MIPVGAGPIPPYGPVLCASSEFESFESKRSNRGTGADRSSVCRSDTHAGL